MATCKCPHCGGEINPASLLGSTSIGKKKTLSESAIAARKANAAKPRPNARKIKEPALPK